MCRLCMGVRGQHLIHFMLTLNVLGSHENHSRSSSVKAAWPTANNKNV
jgi:hypothetical protein